MAGSSAGGGGGGISVGVVAGIAGGVALLIIIVVIVVRKKRQVQTHAHVPGTSFRPPLPPRNKAWGEEIYETIPDGTYEVPVVQNDDVVYDERTLPGIVEELMEVDDETTYDFATQVEDDNMYDLASPTNPAKSRKDEYFEVDDTGSIESEEWEQTIKSVNIATRGVVEMHSDTEEGAIYDLASKEPTYSPVIKTIHHSEEEGTLYDMAESTTESHKDTLRRDEEVTIRDNVYDFASASGETHTDH